MTDILLTILGTAIYIPFLLSLVRTQWDKRSWSRQVLLSLLLLQGVTLLHIPSVMYICAGCIFAAGIVYLVKEKPAFHWKPMFVVAILYIAWFAVSLTWSRCPQKGALLLLDNGLPLIGFALLGCTVTISKEEYQRMLRTLCYAGLIFIGMSVIAWIVSSIEVDIKPWEWPILQKERIGDYDSNKWIFRWLGGITGYTHPSYNLLPLFAITSLAMWLRKERKLPAWIWWVLWSGGVVLTLLSQSRMGCIYSAIILFAYLVYKQDTIRKKMITGGTLAVIGGIALAFSLGFWKDYGKDPIRDDLRDFTVRYIHAKPWLGAGAGALNPIEMCHTIGSEYWPHVGYVAPDADPTAWHFKVHMLPHNQWMADWAHGGIAAALLAIGIYLCFAIECIRKRRMAESVFLLVFILFSFMEPPLYIGKGLYLFCLLAFFLYAYPKREK